jgi:hypothetical protein
MNASHGQEMNVIKRKEELCVVAVDSEIQWHRAKGRKRSAINKGRVAYFSRLV